MLRPPSGSPLRTLATPYSPTPGGMGSAVGTAVAVGAGVVVEGSAVADAVAAGEGASVVGVAVGVAVASEPPKQAPISSMAALSTHSCTR